MSLLNEIWHFIVVFKSPQQIRNIFPGVQEELFASFYLTSLGFIDFRLPPSPVVTASLLSRVAAYAPLWDSPHGAQRPARAQSGERDLKISRKWVFCLFPFLMG